MDRIRLRPLLFQNGRSQCLSFSDRWSRGTKTLGTRLGYPRHQIRCYPFIHLNEERHCESKNTMQCPQPGLELGPLDPESSALTMKPPPSHKNLKQWFNTVSNMCCALIHLMQCALIHSKTTYLTYTEAPVLIQNISILANTSKTADGILTSAICTNAGDLGAFIHICRKKEHKRILGINSRKTLELNTR